MARYPTQTEARTTKHPSHLVKSTKIRRNHEFFSSLLEHDAKNCERFFAIIMRQNKRVEHRFDSIKTKRA